MWVAGTQSLEPSPAGSPEGTSAGAESGAGTGHRAPVLQWETVTEPLGQTSRLIMWGHSESNSFIFWEHFSLPISFCMIDVFVVVTEWRAVSCVFIMVNYFNYLTGTQPIPWSFALFLFEDGMFGLLVIVDILFYILEVITLVRTLGN